MNLKNRRLRGIDVPAFYLVWARKDTICKPVSAIASAEKAWEECERLRGLGYDAGMDWFVNAETRVEGGTLPPGRKGSVK